MFVCKLSLSIFHLKDYFDGQVPKLRKYDEIQNFIIFTLLFFLLFNRLKKFTLIEITFYEILTEAVKTDHLISKEFFKVGKITQWNLLYLTLRRPNVLGVHGPVSPDLAKTVKVRSDHSENLTNVFGGAKNGNFSHKSLNIFWKLSEIDFFRFDLHRK